MNKASRGNGIPVELFQILKDDTLKCCTQYASKFGKLRSGHRTRKGQFSFQSQRKVMPKNVQTLHNCTHLTCQPSNAQNSPSQASTVCEQRISRRSSQIQKRQRNQPLPTSTGSSKKQENSRKASTFASLTKLKPLTVWITTTWKILKEMRISDHLTCLLRNLYAGQERWIRGWWSKDLHGRYNFLT